MAATVNWFEPSRSFCGTTPVEFEMLVARFEPLALQARIARADQPGRQRAYGGGDKPAEFEFRLLVTLALLRQNLTVRAAATIFGIHERTVRRFRDEITGLFAAYGCQPPGAVRPIRTGADLLAHLDSLPEEYVSVDATETPRPAPMDWDEQRAAWSGKSHDHVLKGTVVADRSRRPLWFEPNPTGEGRTHDITMLRSQLGLMMALTATTAVVLGDKAYQGLWHELGYGNVITPIKKTKQRPLEPGDVIDNRIQSSLRMPVEHAIGRMKWWRVLTQFRAAPDRYGTIGKAVATLASLT